MHPIALILIAVSGLLTTSPHPGAVVASSTGIHSDSSGEHILEVPDNLRPEVRSTLLEQRAALVREIDDLNHRGDRLNARCASVPDQAALDRCRSDLAKLMSEAQQLNIRKLNFNEAVREATRRGLKIVEPPSPEVVRENARFIDDPVGWYHDQESAVREAVKRNREWTRDLLSNLTSRRPRSYEITHLSELTPGDIILVAPTDVQRAPAEFIGQNAIRAGDYLYRVAEDLANGKVFRASTEEVEPPSHALTYVKSVGDKMLFLNQDHRGARVIDQEIFLRQYGAREMFVARPQDVVAGRRLWSAASNAARGSPCDYGVGQGRYTCAHRAGIVVAQSTGADLSNHRLGPIDITPGDFFDPESNTGKHFVIAHLRIDAPARPNR